MFSDVTYPALFVMTQRIRFCILGLDRHSIVAIYVEESVCGSDGDLHVGINDFAAIVDACRAADGATEVSQIDIVPSSHRNGSRVCTPEPAFGVKLMYDWPTMTPARR